MMQQHSGRLVMALAAGSLATLLAGRVEATEDYSEWGHSTQVSFNTTASGANVPSRSRR